MKTYVSSVSSGQLGAGGSDPTPFLPRHPRQEADKGGLDWLDLSSARGRCKHHWFETRRHRKCFECMDVDQAVGCHARNKTASHTKVGRCWVLGLFGRWLCPELVLMAVPCLLKLPFLVLSIQKALPWRECDALRALWWKLRWAVLESNPERVVFGGLTVVGE